LINREHELGSIDISNSVFAAISGYAATNSFGVKGMAARNVRDGLVRLIGMDAVDKGVKVVFTENGLEIELHIIVKHGINIMAACRQIMSQVKYIVGKLTGETVSRVDICVDSVLVD
jgi:uncharacterized alkaline shock family protein YloU